MSSALFLVLLILCQGKGKAQSVSSESEDEYPHDDDDGSGSKGPSVVYSDHENISDGVEHRQHANLAGEESQTSDESGHGCGEGEHDNDGTSQGFIQADNTDIAEPETVADQAADILVDSIADEIDTTTTSDDGMCCLLYWYSKIHIAIPQS